MVGGEERGWEGGRETEGFVSCTIVNSRPSRKKDVGVVDDRCYLMNNPLIKLK